MAWSTASTLREVVWACDGGPLPGRRSDDFSNLCTTNPLRLAISVKTKPATPPPATNIRGILCPASATQRGGILADGSNRETRGKAT
ncbi:hypothetical protein B296_00023355 [Ensete ventricosum]|uniref:Uncharacterized protein n=1 Tax=Ensete ventricosum TaxID=4639 RepID=A0A426YVM4_ENSVE|nr:hypothetical protein B296_00023355 [Ensete ventricosum]